MAFLSLVPGCQQSYVLWWACIACMFDCHPSKRCSLSESFVEEKKSSRRESCMVRLNSLRALALLTWAFSPAVALNPSALAHSPGSSTAYSGFRRSDHHVAIMRISSSSDVKVEVYTTPGCRYCARAKGFLRQRSVEFAEIDVSASKSILDEMIQRADKATLPQIFVAGELVGGCDDMLLEHERGTLRTRMEAAGVAMLDESQLEPSDERASGDNCSEAGIVGVSSHNSSSVLNTPVTGQPAADTNTVGAADLSTSLQKQMLVLMDDHLSEDGSRVNYAALRVSSAFIAFCRAVSALSTLPLEALGSSVPLNDRKSFWINLYNVLVLHATAVLGAPVDAETRSAFFKGDSGAAYDVCGVRFCLDDIEHGILRCNALPVGASSPRFAMASDPRLSLVLPEPVDPRIHFALNCGARSCPPIKFYAADRLEESLALSTRAFLEADLACDLDSGELSCTKLLDWYGVDFGKDVRARIERLRMLLEGSSLYAALGELLKANTEPRLEFRAYDWASNEA